MNESGSFWHFIVSLAENLKVGEQADMSTGEMSTYRILAWKQGAEFSKFLPKYLTHSLSYYITQISQQYTASFVKFSDPFSHIVSTEADVVDVF